MSNPSLFHKTQLTGGKYRGRIIKTPKTKSTHPMGSRERLALFNMLTPYLDGAKITDAFAGSGALGFEALSRGAKTVTFLENNPKAVQTIKENIASLKLENQANVIKATINPNIEEILLQEQDIIIADPPYDNFHLEDILFLSKYLKVGGILVLSHPGDAPTISTLKPLKTRTYANASISIFQKV